MVGRQIGLSLLKFWLLGRSLNSGSLEKLRWCTRNLCNEWHFSTSDKRVAGSYDKKIGVSGRNQLGEVDNSLEL